MLLVVDQESLRIISSAFGMYKLMENRVYLVENLVKKRAPYRNSAPIYFLSPTEESVKCLITDWTPTKDRKEPLYADSVFLYFTKALPDTLFYKIKECKPLVKRLKVLGEVNLDFIVKQSRAFHLDMKSPDYFAQLFKGAANASRVEHAIADSLVTVCASLNEYPHIRYKVTSRLGLSITRLFNKKIKEFISKNRNWWYHGDPQHTEKGRSTLLILSRIDDCLSPLIHEFTYQAMVNDLLKLDDDKITFKSPNPDSEANELIEKDALLNESDELWIELRGMHIADVIQVLSGRIRDIVTSNTGVALKTKGSDAKSLSLNQMAKALKALPEYREVMSKLAQHMHISHKCMDIFKQQNLLDLSVLEQTLATGKNDEGRSPRLSELIEDVLTRLQNTPDSVDRFRLLAILLVSQNGMKPTDQSRLLTTANLGPAESEALGNLNAIGIPLVQPLTANRRAVMGGGDKLIQRETVADSGSEYNTSRYSCALKNTLKNINDGRLSFEEYPSLFPMPDEGMMIGGRGNMASSGVGSVRRNDGSRFRRNFGPTTKKFDGSRQIVFMIGGACYSELRAVQELMDDGGPEIIFGATHFINPSDFVGSISAL